MNDNYEAVEPSRGEIDATTGTTLIEFGTPWCGFCKAAQPLLAQALAEAPALQHLKIEDGSGKPLGRSFNIKLWPTLVFMRDGRELARVVRPGDAQAIRQALQQALG
ncbi:MAG: thioredoxin family protein [Variovorax sp.]